MPDPMTAEALHALVSQWPVEARPEMVDTTRDGSWCLYTDRYMTLAHAIALHEASGLRWLIELGYAVWQDQIDGMFRVGPWNETRSWEGRTLIEALHAAIMATAKEQA